MSTRTQRRRQTDTQEETAPPRPRTWLVGVVVVSVVLFMLLARSFYQLPKPLAVHDAPVSVSAPTLAPQGDDSLVVATDIPPVPVVRLIRDTAGFWSASAPDGPAVHAGTVLHLDARTADGLRMLAGADLWAQPLWVASQDTDVDAAVLFALPVLTDPTATPVPTDTPVPLPPTPVPLVCATVTDGGDVSVTRCAPSWADAQAAADAAFDEAFLSSPPPTNVPYPTLTVQPAVPAWPTSTPVIDAPLLDTGGGA